MPSVETGAVTASLKFLVVIPHYNHAATLRRVAQECCRAGQKVLVVDDGSDESPEPLLQGLPVSFVRHEKNQGKGQAILTAAAWARARGLTHIITVDGDGQHLPSEIPLFVAAAQERPDALILGVRRFDDTVPRASRFGRAFGNFWVRVQTGQDVGDIQSGFRCYPVALLEVIKTYFGRYAFEVEIVVRALWAGLTVCQVPVRVVYTEHRVSHFHAWKDNFRLTVLNTCLTIRSMVPLAHRHYECVGDKLIPQDYRQTLREHLTAPGSAVRNGASAAWGIFCGSIAFPGVRQVWLFGGAGWWNLNRLLCVGFEKLCIGPFIPALCIEVGYFMCHGTWLTQFNLTTLGKQFLWRVGEWVLGSLVVAPVLAGLTFILVWAVGKIGQRSFHE